MKGNVKSGCEHCISQVLVSLIEHCYCLITHSALTVKFVEETCVDG